VDTTESRESLVIEALHTNGQPVDPYGAIACKTRCLRGARVGFERDLGLGAQSTVVIDCRENAADRISAEKRRRATADEDGCNPPAGRTGCLLGNIPEQRFEVSRLRQFAAQSCAVFPRVQVQPRCSRGRPAETAGRTRNRVRRSYPASQAHAIRQRRSAGPGPRRCGQTRGCNETPRRAATGCELSRQLAHLAGIARGEDEFHELASASRCSVCKAVAPCLARSSIFSSSSWRKAWPSAVPCTSMYAPASFMTTFMSVSACESSA